MATVLGFGTAVPATNFSQDELWKAWYADQPSPTWDAERTWFATTVKSRHLAVDPFTEMSSEWPSTVRTARYLTEGLALGVEAAQKAIAEAGVSASDVGLLAVASSTAPATQNPGLDVLIARELGIRRSARRLRLGPIGCHAALPLLSVGCDYADSHDGPALLLACEVSSVLVGSLAVADSQQVVAHALFADAAGAVIVGKTTDRVGSLTVVDSVVVTVDEHADLLRWGPEDQHGGLRMLLSPRLPATLGRYIKATVGSFLASHGLTVDAVTEWAVHPGGPDILTVVQRTLGLSDHDLLPSREILADNGNCSSATVVLILDHLLKTRPVGPGGSVVGLAFGPGLSMAVTLLQAS